MKIKMLSALMLGAHCFTASANVFISEYVEGSGNNKAIEIYNNSETGVDISQHQIKVYFNGGSSAGTTISLSGEIAPFSTYVIATTSSDDGLQMNAQLLTGASMFNGDDFIELVVSNGTDGETVLDTIGQFEVDPGSAYSVTVDGVTYSTQNKTLVRHSNITIGDPDGSNVFDPSAEWEVFAQDDFSNIGSHSTTDTPDNGNGGSDGGTDGGTGGGSDGGTDGGSDGGTDGGSDSGNGDLSGQVCTNCPDLAQFKDPSAFDAQAYYAEVNQLLNAEATASQIKAALSSIISTDIQRLTYSEVWTALTATDEDPNNSDNVILLYSGRSIPKASNGSGAASSNGDNWNREHSWPKSHGFSSSSDEPYTDIHHLRPTDISINSARGNLDYDESDAPLSDSQITSETDPTLRAAILAATADNFVDGDSFEPNASVKGDVARMMFYMDTRYEAGGTYLDLVLVDQITSTGSPTLGKLCTLIQWHNDDPVSEFEISRNERIYQYQGNRNPFIDNPQWVDLLYSSETCGDVTGGGSDGGTGGGSDGGTGGGSDGGTDGGSDGGTDGGSDGGTDGGSVNAPMLISAIFDGPLSGGVPKGIEVFVTQDIPDLSVCAVRTASNGNQPTGSDYTIDIGGANSAQSGDYLYFSSESTGFTSFFGFAPNGTTGELSINGDDAVLLVCDGAVVDVYGVVGVDGSGENWEYLDGWAYRNSESGPNINFDASEWTFSGRNALDGESSNSNAMIPVGTYTAATGGVFISEYIEGSSFNKAIEIVNLSGSAIDLSDYSIRLYSNGSNTPSAESPLSGTLAANDVYVIANPGFEDNADNPVVDEINSVINFNGDDAFALADSTGNIDVIGQIGVRQVWSDGDVSTQNATIRRKSNVTVGDADGSDVFSPAIEWDGFPINDTSDLGLYGDASGGGDGGGPVDEVMLGVCFDPATGIHEVQGESDTSPLLGQTVVVEGVVTLVSGQLGGFFMQEEDADHDSNPLTSEGIFVATDFAGVEIQEGDVVRVLGSVAEQFGKTQLNPESISSFCSSDFATPVSLELPLTIDLESIESMVIESSEEWFVNNLQNYGRFGELVLADEVRYSPTHLFAPESAEAAALDAQNDANQIILDDLLNGTPEIFDLPAGGFDANNPIRIGDSFLSVVGIMDFGFSRYRIRPLQTPVLEQNSFRTEAPELESGNLKIASFNVLNLFNGNGLGDGYPTARGAETEEQYQLQLQKITNAIIAMDADVVGLMEIENDGFDELSSIAQLVNSINANLGDDVYEFVSAGEAQGTDAITVGIIYKPETVSPQGAVKVLNSDNSIVDETGAPLFDTSLNRPSFAQEFVLNESDKPFVVNVNHLKSKGSGSRCIQENDNGTLAGNCNVTRTRAAQALQIWLAEQFQDTPVMIIGDLNAYAKEDPIQTLVNAGYKDVARELEGELAYSYRFSGLLGSLDYALANEQAFDAIVDVTEWHINADEYAGFDYTPELPFSSASKPDVFLSEGPYRSSDHDPVIVSLLLEADAPAFGDVNADGVINFSDYFAILRSFGAREGSPRFNPLADLDNSGRITFRDLYVWYFAYLFSR